MSILAKGYLECEVTGLVKKVSLGIHGKMQKKGIDPLMNSSENR